MSIAPVPVEVDPNFAPAPDAPETVISNADPVHPAPPKQCFIVSPIGSRDSDIRRRADDIRDFVIKPAVEPLGYVVRRADDISDPGLIIDQVINAIADADLAVADLTHLNPNVLYELAVRHQTRKPLVTIASTDTVIPFDINQVRTIFFDHHDLRSVDTCINDIQAQVSAMQLGTYVPSNPILHAQRLQAVLANADPAEQLNLPVYHLLSDINLQLGSISYRLNQLEATSARTGSAFPPDPGGSESYRSTAAWRRKGAIDALIEVSKLVGVDAQIVAESEATLAAAFAEKNLTQLQNLQSELVT